jgi:23S rRNA (uracil1939-C5)-methyltransferase
MTENVTISRLGRQGEGVALVDGRPVFVPYALPGEEVSVERHDDRARLVEVRVASPHRVAPFCRHFGACGGCSVQHLEKQQYLRWKHDIVASVLRREGLVTEIPEIIEAHGDGRRRATLHGRAAGAGYNAARSHSVHPINACPLLAPALKAAPSIVNAVFKEVKDCDVTLTETEGGLDCAVKAHKHAQPLKLAPLAERFALSRLALNADIVVTRNPPVVRMGDSQVIPPPGGFLQPTRAGEETLVRLAADALGRSRHIADLFSGVGPFALRLARTARVHAFDSDAAAIAALKDAVRNTQGLKPVIAETRDLHREPLTAAELNAFDAVVLDPPRAGAEAQARALARSRVPHVVSISCDPGTFARDAHILVEGGYRFLRATPVDQFAWSAHVEIVGVFSR